MCFLSWLQVSLVKDGSTGIRHHLNIFKNFRCIFTLLKEIPANQLIIKTRYTQSKSGEMDISMQQQRHLLAKQSLQRNILNFFFHSFP